MTEKLDAELEAYMQQSQTQAQVQPVDMVQNENTQ